MKIIVETNGSKSTQPCPEAHEETLATIVRAFKPRKMWVVEIKSLQHLARFIEENDPKILGELIITDTPYKDILFEVEFRYFN